MSHLSDPLPLHPDQDVWRELAALQAENSALRAVLREYGLVCLLAGKELIRMADDAEIAAAPSPGHPPAA